MVKYVDLLLSTSKILKANFPDINIEINKNRGEFQTSTFYVKVVPLTNQDVLSDMRVKLTNIFITYVRQGALAQEKLIKTDEMCDVINNIPIYDVTKGKVVRILPIMKREILSKDDMPTLKLTLNYFDSRTPPIDSPGNAYDELMKIIHLNTYINDEKIESFDIK